MSEKQRKRGLGRGLSSLLEDVAPSDEAAAPASAYRTVPIEMIRANPNQPRKTFPPGEMEELVRSVKQKGVLQPLLVRPDPDRPGGFEIIAGERRWRAAQAAQLHEAPVILRDFSDEESLEIAIIENVQRADLNPIEEGEGYKRLLDQFGHTQEALATATGKSRPHIANTLRLLSLPEEVREALAGRRLSAGHARALITAADPAALARKVIEEGLTVRQTEDLARKVAAPVRKSARSPQKDADTKTLEDDLSAALNLRVAIAHQASGRGEVRISYKDLEELDGLCRLMMG